MNYNLLYLPILILVSICGLTIKYCFKLYVYRQVYELEKSVENELVFGRLSKNILHRIMKETKSSGGIIYWFDEVQNRFKLKSFQKIPAQKLNQITRNLSKKGGLLEQVINSPEELLLKENNNHLTRTVGLEGLGGLFSIILALPLNTSKKTAGILLLFKSGSNFSKRDRRLLKLFAERVAVQLDHSRLFQLATDTAHENAKLYVNISKLYHKAILDGLTGLYNRHFLILKLKEEIKKAYRYQQPLSLIFTDIDLFKQVNDQFGHSVGDQVLIEFADLLKKSVREFDFACRFGGEEFVIILPQTNTDSAELLAERLREKTAASLFSANNIKIKFTASFGISSLWYLNSDNSVYLGDEALNNIAENLLASADDALYRAKQGGRNKVIIFEDR